MNCPECGKEIEQEDTTYSNMNTDRAKVGEQTGNIYWCEECETWWLENFLNGHKLERFYY